MTPLRVFSGWPKASITFRDQSTSSSVGEKISCRGNLARMDQGLAIHAQRPPAFALLAQALLILEVVVDAIDDVESVGTCRSEGHGEPRHDREAVVQGAGARILDQIVGAHDEAAEPVLGIDGGGGDGARVQNRHGRFHHGPQPDLFRGMHALRSWQR